MTMLDAKIIKVDTNNSQDNQEVTPHLPEETATEEQTQASGFESVGKDNWRAITATPSDIGDMMDAINGIEAESQYTGPIDRLIDSLVIDDPIQNPAGLDNHEFLNVPDLYKDLIYKNGGLLKNMKPIVERYELIVSKTKDLIANARYALQQPMTSKEAESYQVYLEKLNDSLLDAQVQLEEAKYYYQVQKLEEQAAREASES